MLWLKRFNFMETAKLEMELMKAFEAGVDLDANMLMRQLLETRDAADALHERWVVLDAGKCGRKSAHLLVVELRLIDVQMR